jgi:sulfatase modifying factor 1
MKFNLIITFTVIILVFGLNSCYENTIFEQGKPELEKISTSLVNLGDDLTIYGKNLGINPENAKIMIDSFLIANSKSATIQIWNNSFIKIKVDTNFKTGNLFIIIGKDTTKKLQITYNDIFKISLIQVFPVSSFKMGSNEGAEDEAPEHNVKLTKKLEVSTYEVTQKLWNKIMNYNPSSLLGDSLPVINVSWDSAIVFCNKLSLNNKYPVCYIYDNTKKTWIWANDSGGYRLPTEAEWEFFARANSTNEISGTGNIDDMAWYDMNSGFNTHKVGLKKPNTFGLYDVHGNAREWCWDYYQEDYYINSELNDPRGPETSKTKLHVARGGSSIDAIKYHRLTSRSYKDTSISFNGLRLVRTIK